jgi:hypothetical protein
MLYSGRNSVLQASCAGALPDHILPEPDHQLPCSAFVINEAGIEAKLWHYYDACGAHYFWPLAGFLPMVMPSVMMDPETKVTHVPNMLADFGIALGFVGLIMFVTARALSKHPLVAKNHPFLKESIVHHT